MRISDGRSDVCSSDLRAVIAESFERIHRSNLVGMGVLPLEFKDGQSRTTLGLDGSETIDIVGVEQGLKPRMDLTCRITRADGKTEEIQLRCRIDTLVEVDYSQHGDIRPNGLRLLRTETRTLGKKY